MFSTPYNILIHVTEPYFDTGTNSGKAAAFIKEVWSVHNTHIRL